MLKFKCEECQNSKGLIYRDDEGDLVTECLACEHIEVVGESVEG